ncbi:MAG: HD domain-containing phosphohydrolase [Dehalococcoidia bacterium]
MTRKSQYLVPIENDEAILREWRTRAVTIILYILLAVALPAVISTVAYALNNGLWALTITVIIVYLLLIPVAFFKHWEYRLRASIILAIGYIMAVITLAMAMLPGAGVLYLIVMPILAIILIGTHAGWIATVVSALIYGILCIFAYTGLLSNLLYPQFGQLDINMMLVRGFTMMMLIILIVALLTRMNRFLLNALKSERASAAELVKTYDATLEGWAHALELRDIETSGHCHRVGEITKRLARETHLANGELVDLHRGALLHDIGKMGIPDSILLKPGKLTADEFKQMQEHTTYAYDLLAHIPYLLKALDIPYCHHEKWDGSGYPRGLKGTDIPLSARIFSVVDVYDALISDRPYRPAWPEEKALDYIKERSGTEFDPAVVAAFIKLAQEETDSLDES